MKKRSFTIIAAAAVAISALALASTRASAQDWGAIGTSIFGGVQQLAEAAKDITPSEEYYIGRAVGALILEKYPPLGNDSLDRYVTKVGLAVAYHSDRPVTFGGYHFAVLNSDEVNAFAAPGGTIFITKGLLKEIQSEDQLANVLGHEIRHIVDRDGIKAIKKSRWTKFGFYAAGEVGKHYTPSEIGDLVGEFQSVVTDVAKQVIENGYSKSDEADADKYAMRYAANAGYNPQAMADFIRGEAEKGSAGHSGPFSSHPSAGDRLKKVEATLAAENLSGTTVETRTSRYASATAGAR